VSDHDEYVEGDVNRVDDAAASDQFDDDDLDDDELEDDEAEFEDDAVDGDRADAANDASDEGALAGAVLTHIATSLAEEPGAVSVEKEARGRRITLRLSVAQQDMGRVIGRRGRTAQAIRALVAAAGAKEGVSTSVDIVD
jgi:uncharacterized protein